MEKYDHSHNMLQAAREQERLKAKEDFQLLLFFFFCLACLGVLIFFGIVTVNSHLHLF